MQQDIACMGLEKDLKLGLLRSVFPPLSAKGLHLHRSPGRVSTTAFETQEIFEIFEKRRSCWIFSHRKHTIKHLEMYMFSKTLLCFG